MYINKGTVNLKEKKFDYKVETERLIIRLLLNDDYECWLSGFENVGGLR